MLPPQGTSSFIEIDPGSSEGVPRRPACDRCRGQKLRCERRPENRSSTFEPGSLPPCRRCQRAGAICNTTSPPTQSTTHIHQHGTSIAAEADAEDSQRQSRPHKRRNTSIPSLSHHFANHATNGYSSPRMSAATVSAAPLAPVDDNLVRAGSSAPLDMAAIHRLLTPSESDSHDADFSDDLMFADFTRGAGQIGNEDHDFDGSLPPLASSNTASTLDSFTWHRSDPMVEFGDVSTPPDRMRGHSGPASGAPMVSRPKVDDRGKTAYSKDRALQGSLKTLAQLNTSATLDAARVHSTFLHVAGSDVDDGKLALIERIIKDSATFVDVLRSLTEHLATTTDSINATAVFGTDTQVTLVTLQVVAVYVSCTKLHQSILEYVKGALSSKLNVDWCRRLYSSPGQSTPALLNDNYLWVKIFVETCVHLVDVMHRRMELLSESGRLTDMASSVLNIALGHNAQRHSEERTYEVNLTKSALKQNQQDIIRMMDEGLG